MRHIQAGFTLIEIMVVVVILGILATLVAPSVIQNVTEARINKARSDLRVVSSQLELFRLHAFRYPSTDEGIESLVNAPADSDARDRWKGPYLPKVPLDPWGRPYLYLSPGSKAEVDVYTLGQMVNPVVTVKTLTSETGTWINMASSAGVMRRARGFTLLELMVVVVIIAVIVSLAVISLGGNSTRKLDEEARRLQTLIRLAADEAILEGREIGVSITGEGYEFLVYDDQFRQWQNMEREPIFRPRTMPDGISLELFLDDQELVLAVEDPDDDEIRQPQVLLLSSGEMTPFELVLQMDTTDNQVVLQGTPNGTVEQVFGEN